MYNYAKYENATRKDIIKALNLAEKKEKKLQEQLKENKEFFKFLQKKFNESFNSLRQVKTKKQKKYDEPTEETKLILAKNEPTKYNNFNDLLNAIDDELKDDNA
ncbi:hypothetical protein ACSQDT_000743 [Campylobacter upsaliensis]